MVGRTGAVWQNWKRQCMPSNHACAALACGSPMHQLTKPGSEAGGGHGQPAEEVLWCYMAQLTCAARAAHSAGLLLQPQSLAPSKVILTSPRRVRVGKSVEAHPCVDYAVLSATLSLTLEACCSHGLLESVKSHTGEHGNDLTILSGMKAR